MKRLIVLAVFLAIIVSTSQAFSQSSFASLSGTITDSTSAIVPGVTVTVTNVGTGITNTALSNNAGVYSFPSLLPGTYKVSSEKSGFQTQTFTDVALGNAAQIRLNFKLPVAGITQSVEVSVAPDRMLLESSSSSGEVLIEKSIQALPLVNSNALDLVKIAVDHRLHQAGHARQQRPTFVAVEVVHRGAQRGDAVDEAPHRMTA